ncbi:hypothetical protein [Actinoplanes palleronii]|uniref:TgtA5 cluster protein 2 n=1 Tax=Actinoplanes palleronii TaxID=113570 RepID=A0ABQ4B238_9ACTN|nr:hypothetical protein [Actinoplanes palleronii]GIE64556.1 hypothetical protein Apa02nite_006640 [Actinoplanes palleronii]
MSEVAPAASPIHLIVTCANRKKVVIPEGLRLGDLREYPPAERFPVWAERLATTTTLGIPAFDLYAGEHWQAVRTLQQTVNDTASLWVCSAGYGLVPMDADLAPYAATFAPGERDSAGSSLFAMREWWRQLTRWQWPAEYAPRSFADLARQDPRATIIAVLSESYMRACADDLREAATCLADPEQFAILGPPNRCAELDKFVVPVTATLRPVVGGSMQALNVRAATHLLTLAGSNLGFSALRKLAQESTESAPPDPGRRPAGKKLNDHEVRNYIRQALGDGDGVGTATQLLRRLRSSGQSCEQARFHALFAEIRAEAV